MTDDDLPRRVAAELCWDPQVDSTEIEIRASGGMITLRGTVASLWQKRAGGNAAARVRGVTRVANNLLVQIPDADRREDEELRGDVLEALMLNISVPMSVDAQAQDGCVTLAGVAEWQYQRQAAEVRATNVPGVARIENTIALTPTHDADEAHEDISRAFRRDALLEEGGLSVQMPVQGLVILSGTVSCWAAHDHALAAAWSAPGVTQVDDRICVGGQP